MLDDLEHIPQTFKKTFCSVRFITD